MTKRNPLVVLALTLVTFTVYAYYWLWVTTKELKDETGRTDLEPAIDVILAIVTLGLWGIYAAWRNARIVHEELQARGETHEDRSALVAFCGVASYAVGFAWLVGVLILQEEFNRLAGDAAPALLRHAATDVPEPITY